MADIVAVFIEEFVSHAASPRISFRGRTYPRSEASGWLTRARATALRTDVRCPWRLTGPAFDDAHHGRRGRNSAIDLIERGRVQMSFGHQASELRRVAGKPNPTSAPARPFSTECSGTQDVPHYSVPDLMAAHNIGFLDLLHFAQGAELGTPGLPSSAAPVSLASVVLAGYLFLHTFITSAAIPRHTTVPGLAPATPVPQSLPLTMYLNVSAATEPIVARCLRLGGRRTSVTIATRRASFEIHSTILPKITCVPLDP